MAEMFGRYELSTLLGHGGMAEVFKASQLSATGANKQMVVKRILPAMSQHQDFRQMFLDEGRLTTQLSHGNVVQVFEAGEVNGQLFLAMEWVDGVGLDKVLQHARERRMRLPPVVAVMIVIEALKGLHHAHTRVDGDGKLLHIVHRDISPDNLLVSFEGQVKLNDFGIAKAALEGRPETQSGVFKGKLSYGAPEQIRGEKVDARADLFSLGVVLHEMLSGNNPIGQRAVELALTGAPLPRIGTFFVGEDLPEIVARATASRPEDRYPSALAFQQALTGWMLPRAGAHAATGIAHLMTWLFPAETGARGLAQPLDADTLRWLESNPLEPEPEAGAPLDPTAVSGGKPVRAVLATPGPVAVAPPPEPAPLDEPASALAVPSAQKLARNRRVALAVSAVGLLAGGGGTAGFFEASRYFAAQQVHQGLTKAQSTFEGGDLLGARSALEPLLSQPHADPEAVRLAAAIDAETAPSAALNQLSYALEETSHQHRPLDAGRIAPLLETAKKTTHFAPRAQAFAARVDRVRHLPTATLEQALAASPDKWAALLPCPAERCDDAWYTAQLAIERSAHAELDAAEQALGERRFTVAREHLQASGDTLYQADRRDALTQKLRSDLPEVTLEDQVRNAIASHDFAAAQKLLDACAPGATGCGGREGALQLLEEEQAFEHDIALAERALADRRAQRATYYFQYGARTRVFEDRADQADQKLAQLARNRAEVNCALAGQSYLYDGKRGEALALLKACVVNDPANVAAWSMLGDAFDSVKQYGPALDAYAHFVDLAATYDKSWPEIRSRIADVGAHADRATASRAQALLASIRPATVHRLLK